MSRQSSLIRRLRELEREVERLREEVREAKPYPVPQPYPYPVPSVPDFPRDPCNPWGPVWCQTASGGCNLPDGWRMTC